MESMESHKDGFPPFPHSLEIPSGLAHSHGLDDEGGIWKQRQRLAQNRSRSISPRPRRRTNRYLLRSGPQSITTSSLPEVCFLRRFTIKFGYKESYFFLEQQQQGDGEAQKASR